MKTKIEEHQEKEGKKVFYELRAKDWPRSKVVGEWCDFLNWLARERREFKKQKQNGINKTSKREVRRE